MLDEKIKRQTEIYRRLYQIGKSLNETVEINAPEVE